MGRMDYRRVYRSAAVSLVDLVSRMPSGRWEEPGLGEWTLRDLLGHTVSSALRQVPPALATPAEQLAAASPEAYWAFARTVAPEVYTAAMRASGQDARETGASLGGEPLDAVRDMAGRATEAVAAAGDDDVVTSAVGGMRLRDWLPTRTFELVVHGLDLAAAAGVDPTFGSEALADTAAMAARLAADAGDGVTVIKALTGRGTLPGGFSVV
jgi:uncharacterized protein (TIGR03083 family)